MNILKQINFFYVEIVFAQFFPEFVMMLVSGLSIYIFLVTYETQAFNLAQETSSLTRRFQMKQCYA